MRKRNHPPKRVQQGPREGKLKQKLIEEGLTGRDIKTHSTIANMEAINHLLPIKNNQYHRKQRVYRVEEAVF